MGKRIDLLLDNPTSTCLKSHTCLSNSSIPPQRSHSLSPIHLILYFTWEPSLACCRLLSHWTSPLSPLATNTELLLETRALLSAILYNTTDFTASLADLDSVSSNSILFSTLIAKSSCLAKSYCMLVCCWQWNWNWTFISFALSPVRWAWEKRGLGFGNGILYLIQLLVLGNQQIILQRILSLMPSQAVRSTNKDLFSF